MNKQVMITYAFDQKNLSKVQSAIVRFTKAVDQNEPGVMHQHTFQKTGHEYIFFHYVSFADPEAEELHRTAPHTYQFVEELYPYCQKEPEFEELD